MCSECVTCNGITGQGFTQEKREILLVSQQYIIRIALFIDILK